MIELTNLEKGQIVGGKKLHKSFYKFPCNAIGKGVHGIRQPKLDIDAKTVMQAVIFLNLLYIAHKVI